ncbi:MAG: chromosome partitioning protein ParB, partial [Deltaproteobacteria bacterium]|nr:chromosome partitioning protein ParB [Deltaproteobacteria bacterium]
MEQPNESNQLDPGAENQDKLTDWSNEPTIRDLKQNIDDAESDQDLHKQNVDRWLKNRAAKRSKTKGRSNVAPKLIRKQAEWRYSSLADPFLSTPDLFNVYPTTAGDVNRARQNGLILNKQFNTQINKTKFIDDYVREAVDIGTVIVKLSWLSVIEEITEMITDYQYMPDGSGQLAEYYTQLLQLRLQDPEAYADESTPGLDHALEAFQQTGVALFARESGEHEVTRMVETKNQPVIEIPPSENIIVDPSCGGDMSKALFVGEKFKTS